jgi:hypothetical protein
MSKEATQQAEEAMAKQATPHKELIAQLMDSRIPKTEREHAAQREITALRRALEQQPADKHGSPCPEFWDWLPKAYRDGDIGDEPRFTKYNMEVAFLAGKQSLEWIGLTDKEREQLLARNGLAI